MGRRIMSTKAEQFKVEEERAAANAHKGRIRPERSKPGAPPGERTRSKKHAARKATYALEAPAEGRPSRKSTRKSANRAKPDANLNLREMREKSSPEARARKAQ
jgi:hypothetical protein